MAAMVAVASVGDAHPGAGMGVRGGERVRPRRHDSGNDDEGTDESA